MSVDGCCSGDGSRSIVLIFFELPSLIPEPVFQGFFLILNRARDALLHEVHLSDAVGDVLFDVLVLNSHHKRSIVAAFHAAY